MTALIEKQPDLNRTDQTVPPTASARLMSLDALRGFDMFWIVGAASLVAALKRMSPNRVTTFLAYELGHASWEGFHFYDLIFPLFVFISGVSLVFSLTKALEQNGRAAVLKRLFRRGLLLYAAGIFYYGGLDNTWPAIRMVGVLQRIAIAYFFAGLLFCFFKPRALAAICLALLVGYWAMMTFIPIRDIQLTKRNLATLAAKAGDTNAVALFEQDGNPSTVRNSPVWAAAEKMYYATTNRVSGRFLAGWNLSDHCDFLYLPGRRYINFYDPEGLLSTIPAIATGLLGVFAGLLLKNSTVQPHRKIVYLVAFGVTGVVVGWLWNLQFPVIKKIWTSSFVLVAGGYSALLLAAFYWIVDVLGFQRWCRPFIWIGMNSITIYLVENITGGFDRIATRFVGGDMQAWFDSHIAKGFGDLMIALVGLFLAFVLVRFLYQRKVFLRI
jgi:predicted acyltransferase